MHGALRNLCMDDEVIRYPVELVRDGYGSVFVLFPDVPTALAFGTSEREALARASQSLKAALDEHLLTGNSLPEPSVANSASTINVWRSELWQLGRLSLPFHSGTGGG